MGTNKKEVTEIVERLLSGSTTLEFERTVAGQIPVSAAPSQEEAQQRAGELFDALSGGNAILGPQQMKEFLRNHPDCAPILGFRNNGNGFGAANNFGAVLEHTASYSLSRAEFARAIGGQSHQILANRPNPEISLANAQGALADSIKATHAELRGKLALPSGFLSQHDRNNSGGLDIDELRESFKDIMAHPDKYNLTKSPQELQRSGNGRKVE